MRLVEACGDDTALAERVIADATRLSSPEEMGGVYKAMAITAAHPLGSGSAPPAFRAVKG